MGMMTGLMTFTCCWPLPPTKKDRCLPSQTLQTLAVYAGRSPHNIWGGNSVVHVLAALVSSRNWIVMHLACRSAVWWEDQAKELGSRIVASGPATWNTLSACKWFLWKETSSEREKKNWVVGSVGPREMASGRATRNHCCGVLEVFTDLAVGV